MNKTKDIISIKIDNEPFICFIKEDGKIFIEEKINKFFNAGYDKGTIASMAMMKGEIEGKSVYSLKVVVNNLRLRILKQLVEDGFLYRINKAIDKRDNAKERNLSDFDRAILKAIEYNPREKAISYKQNGHL